MSNGTDIDDVYVIWRQHARIAWLKRYRLLLSIGLLGALAVAVMMFPVVVTIYLQSGGNVPQVLYDLAMNMNMIRRIPFNLISIICADLLTIGYAACLYPATELRISVEEHTISRIYVFSIFRTAYLLFFLLVFIPECVGLLVLAVHYQIPISQMNPSFISWDMWLPIVAFIVAALLAANICVLLTCSRRIKCFMLVDFVPVIPFGVYYIVYFVWQFVDLSKNANPLDRMVWPIMILFTFAAYISTSFMVFQNTKRFRFIRLENQL